jgi:hypothetical protein
VRTYLPERGLEVLRPAGHLPEMPALSVQCILSPQRQSGLQGAFVRGQSPRHHNSKGLESPISKVQEDVPK